MGTQVIREMASVGEKMSSPQTYQKFQNYHITAKGEARANVKLSQLKTLWFNTGTLCNLTCQNCYIESSPKNDRLSFLSREDVIPFLEEIRQNNLKTTLIGLTGGEPFLNSQIISILSAILKHDFEVLVLTNAYRAIDRFKDKLIQLKEIYQSKLHIRISLDHYTKEVHEHERGSGTFEKTLQSIKWLSDNGFNISLAGRSLLNEDLDQVRAYYQNLLDHYNIDLNLSNNDKIVIFPEMDLKNDVPEITTACWDILGKKPEDQMCATERMIVKRKGEDRPKVVPCTLLAYGAQFELGENLRDAKQEVFLNHPFCAQFCVLGGASCSSTK